MVQVIILMGGARTAGWRSGLIRHPALTWRPDHAPREVWAERVEVMEQELAAIAQRMELLGKELKSAAIHLSQAPTA